jgi:hypothetical protein
MIAKAPMVCVFTDVNHNTAWSSATGSSLTSGFPRIDGLVGGMDI